MNHLCSPTSSLFRQRSGKVIGSTRKTLRAFTLLEVILALMIFSIAVVSLVSAINGMGQASIEARQTRDLESRVETALLQITRLPPKEILAGAKDYEKGWRENGVDLKVRIDTLTWQNVDGQPLPGLYRVTATARRVGQGPRDELSGECVLYPPLYNGRP